MGKVFAYARVSTPRQGENGVSLQEQRSAIERYAEQHGLTITRWFEERDTAAKTGRGEFTKMLRLLRLKAADGVVIHKIDRSARNLNDWADLGKLVDAGANIHFTTENLDLRTVAGRLSADIQAVVAAHYSRNLREEAKKGFYGRLKQGFYPLRAPIGYLDQGAARLKVFDPHRAALVREAFERYSTGTVSLLNLVPEMFSRGLRNRNGGRVSVNGLAMILRNPFYIGIMRIHRTGEIFRGNHEHLVTADLFEKVQRVLDGKRADRKQKHVFTYSRLIRCRSCGYSLVGEQVKGHTYYRCHNRLFKKPQICPPTALRENQIDEAVITTLTAIDLSDDELQAIRILIRDRRPRMEAERAAIEQTLRLQQQQTDSRLSKITDLLIEGMIDRSIYETKRHSLLLEQVAIQERFEQLKGGADWVIGQVEKTVELAKRPSKLFQMASPQAKRELVKTLLSNLSVSGKNAEITLDWPFRLIAERGSHAECTHHRGTCRTWEQIIDQLQKHFSEAGLTPAAA